MNRRLLIDIARSLLIARWRQTLVAAIGVTFSITMFIALLSFMTGLNQMLDGLIIDRTAHVRLYNDIRQNPNQPISISPKFKHSYNFISSVKAPNSREAIYNSTAILKTIHQDERVQGIAPKITAPALFNEGSARISGVINGIDVYQEDKLFHFNSYIILGNPNDLSTVPNSIILGKDLAKTLLVDIGDQVYITTYNNQVFPLKLVGYFQSGLSDFDKSQAFASLSTVQKVLGKPAAYITDIQIKLNKIELAPDVAKEYSRMFETQAEDIQTANAQFETGSFIRTLISYVVGITLLIVAGFGIYNILNMMIYEKMDTIAILKATGFSGTDVKKIFLLIALSIGLFGGSLGLLLGYLVSLIIDTVPFHTTALPTITTYPINYNPLFYIIGLSFSLITTYFAGLLPASKASRIDPVVIIRGK